jgi:hypothetical protein
MANWLLARQVTQGRQPTVRLGVDSGRTLEGSPLCDGVAGGVLLGAETGTGAGGGNEPLNL